MVNVSPSDFPLHPVNLIEAIASRKSHDYSGLQNPARRIRCSSRCACHHLSCDYLSPSTQTMATEHGLLRFLVLFFKEKETVFVWDPYIFLGSPVSLHDCTTMRTNHTETWVSWSPTLWLNQSEKDRKCHLSKLPLKHSFSPLLIHQMFSELIELFRTEWAVFPALS